MLKAQTIALIRHDAPSQRRAHRIGITYAYMNDDNRIAPSKMAAIAQHACEVTHGFQKEG